MLLSLVFVLAHTILAASVDSRGGSTPPGSPNSPRSQVAMQRFAASEPPTAEVRSGEAAPNFSYQSSDGRWRRLRDLADKGAVLLMFAPREFNLIRLEREREELLELGVIPMVILDVKPGAAHSLVRRLQLNYMVLADPRCVIASQFNVVDPITQYAVPSWFVIDRRGKVRGLSRGSLPIADYPAVAARALALPRRGAALPTAR